MRLRLLGDDEGAWASATRGRRLLGLLLGLLITALPLFVLLLVLILALTRL